MAPIAPSTEKSRNKKKKQAEQHAPAAVMFSLDSLSEDGIEEEEEELRFGYGSCTPGWLQWHHSARWLLIWISVVGFVQGFSVNAIFPVGLSTLEKQFKLTSTHTGVISSWYDFAVLLVVFPVCHWGTKAHKGRWIGWGGVIMALGSLVCALPHFLSPLYDPTTVSLGNVSDVGQCDASRTPTTESCEHVTPSAYLNPFFLLFILGQTLHGVGSTPLYSIGLAYIDENVSQTASPVYLAVNAMVTSFGPIAGLFAGGSLLKVFVDVDRVSVPPLADSSDPRWIGAWWIGFLIAAAASALGTLPILGFARELPEAKHHRAKDVNQSHMPSKEAAELKKKSAKRKRSATRRAIEEVKEEAEEATSRASDEPSTPRIILNILRNPTFIACVALGIAESIIVNGFAAFMPKILETLLSVTPTLASYLSSLVIFAAAIGVMLGGALIRKYSLQVPGMLKLTLLCHVVAAACMAAFVIRCPPRLFVGINAPYHSERPLLKTRAARGSSLAASFDLNDGCNAECGCHSVAWNPVCDEANGRIFFSACHAGCTAAENNTWSGCSCAPDSPAIVSGYCTPNCGLNMWLFNLLLFVCVVASFAASISAQQILLRVVPFEHRTLAIGVNWTFLRLLGFIPGGILFGVIIDTACIRWEEKCGSPTSCLVYDPARLGWTIMGVAIVCKLASIVATLLGQLAYTPSPHEDGGGASIGTVASHGIILIFFFGHISLIINDDRVVLPPSSLYGANVTFQTQYGEEAKTTPVLITPTSTADRRLTAISERSVKEE